MKFILFSSFSPFLSGPCPIEIHDSTSGPVNVIISTYPSTKIVCKLNKIWLKRQDLNIVTNVVCIVHGGLAENVGGSGVFALTHY